MNNSINPTKGPWRVRQDGPNIQVSQCGPFAKKICNILNGGLNAVENITLSEANANARLIAASYDLLQACSAAIDHQDEKVREIIRLAIKKAKGE